MTLYRQVQPSRANVGDDPGHRTRPLGGSDSDELLEDDTPAPGYRSPFKRLRAEPLHAESLRTSRSTNSESTDLPVRSGGDGYVTVLACVCACGGASIQYRSRPRRRLHPVGPRPAPALRRALSLRPDLPCPGPAAPAPSSPLTLSPSHSSPSSSSQYLLHHSPLWLTAD